MAMPLFDSIFERLPQGKHMISLQGEGEPLAHLKFWTMTKKIVEAGFTPYTITNGSLVDAERMAALFPVVGFSLDTLDPAEAERIGRFNLKQVLQRFVALLRATGSGRIVVHSVDYGQDLVPLRSLLARLGIKQHVVQPLQAKDDFRQRYPGMCAPPADVSIRSPCQYLIVQKMRFFNIDGVELPCVYIKDVSGYSTDKALLQEQLAGRVPKVCTGCRELVGTNT